MMDLSTDVEESGCDFLVIVPYVLKGLDNLAEMIHTFQAFAAHLLAFIKLSSYEIVLSD